MINNTVDNSAEIKECPYCHSTEGYYIKVRYRGNYNFHFNFDGSEADNGHIYEHASDYWGKIAYCLNCHKRIFRVKD